MGDYPSVYLPSIRTIDLVVKYNLDVLDPSQAKAIQRIAKLFSSILPEPPYADLEALVILE